MEGPWDLGGAARSACTAQRAPVSRSCHVVAKLERVRSCRPSEKGGEAEKKGGAFAAAYVS